MGLSLNETRFTASEETTGGERGVTKVYELLAAEGVAGGVARGRKVSSRA